MVIEGQFIVVFEETGRYTPKGASFDVQYMDVALKFEDATYRGRMFGKACPLIFKGRAYEGKVQLKEHKKYGWQVKKVKEYKLIARDTLAWGKKQGA